MQKSHVSRAGNSKAVWSYMKICICCTGTCNPRGPFECFSYEIMQTWSHSNKVGLFAEIEPRLFPEEIVVHEILTRRGVVHLGAFLLHAPVRLCSWPCYMSCGCFYSRLLVALAALVRKISVPGAGWYDMACLGYGSYVDNVITAVFTSLPCWIWKITARLEFSGKGAIL